MCQREASAIKEKTAQAGKNYYSTHKVSLGKIIQLKKLFDGIWDFFEKVSFLYRFNIILALF